MERSAMIPRSPRAAAYYAGVVAVTVVVALSGRDVLPDDVTDGMQQPWAVWSVGVLVLVLAAGVHFGCAAWSVRAVAGTSPGWRRTTQVQLAAAAVDRVVPTGVAGMGVNLRYLVRGGMSPGAAAGALSVLAVLGWATDAGYLLFVNVVGPLVGLPGAVREMAALGTAGVGAGRHVLWPVLGVAVIVAVTVLARRVRRRGPGAPGGARARVGADAAGAARRSGVVAAGAARGSQVLAGGRAGVGHVVRLARRPLGLAQVCAASTGTTAALSLGFVLAVETWGRTTHPAPAGALVVVYLVAVTAGGATALPPFLGVTEAALTAGLVLAGYTTTSAIVVVVVFRALTYWPALPLGWWAGRRLRAQGVL